MVYTQLIIATLVEEKGDELFLLNESGVKFTAEKKYVEQTMDNSDTFKEEKKVTATEMQHIILNTPFTACSITFRKKDVAKKVKDIKAEKEDKKLKASRMTIDGAIQFLIDNPVLDYIPGEIRVIKGYHKGTQDSTGRLEFYDMEDKGLKKAVDLRTVTEVIVKNVKYTL